MLLCGRIQKLKPYSKLGLEKSDCLIAFFAAPSSPGKSALKSKPGGILKKAKIADDEPAPSAETDKMDRQKYEEIFFKFDDKKQSPVSGPSLDDERLKIFNSLDGRVV